MSSEDSLKPWQRPWSTDEMIKNAPNWSLAGDAGLLKHLESFSKNILTKAEETNNSLNKLMVDLSNASLALEEAKNDFRALRNTQFIESRVYEDDETVAEETKVPDGTEGQQQTKEEKDKDFRDAILGGIAVVEKYFDKVEVPGSDSEDETDFTSFVLKPKDPYFDRPLPFLIGSDEWYKKWHVGLLDSSSESEDEKESEKFSDSDSVSESSYNENKVNEISANDRPVANSTFNDSVKPPLDLFGDSDTDTTGYNTQTTGAQRNFANELAAKLGSYVAEPEVNRKPINTVVNVNKQYGNLFSDEPPPIDEFNENNNTKGLFSGGEGLFDDLDGDVNLWNEGTQKIKKKSSFKNLFDADNDLFSDAMEYNSKSSEAKETSAGDSISRGLFDDEDDDLFNENSYKNITTQPAPYLPPAKSLTMPYFADAPPELEPPAATESKKTFGGVKLIDQSDLDRLRRGRPSAPESSDDNKSLPPIISQEVPKKSKQLSLFDDDDEEDERALFEKDLFSTIDSSLSKLTDMPKPRPTSLFDAPVENPTSIVEPKENELPAENIPPLPNIFDSNPSDLDWDTRSDVFDNGGLFDDVQEISGQRSGLFDNEPPSLFFESSSGVVRDISTTRVGNDESFSPHASSSRRLSSDIFNEQQSNDSFFITKNKSQFEHQHVQSNLEIIPEASYMADGAICDSNLEITPSGDPDNLYSEVTASDIDQSQSDVNETNSTLSKLDSPGKLKHNLQINVGALVPGASPPKKKQNLEDESNYNSPIDNLTAVDSNVLPSITKNRVRIPVKRRPSTRKARQESLRNSVPDFSIVPAPQETLRNSVPDFSIVSVTDEDSPKVDTKPLQSLAEPEFVDIFEENLPPLPTIAQTINVKLFDEDNDSPLFSNVVETLNIAKQVTSVIEAEPKKPHIDSKSFESEDYKQLRLFDDADEFEDIFSSNKLPPKSNILKESLFDDDDVDDDDIFGASFKSRSKSKGGTTSLGKKPPKSTQVKKLENSQAVDDPLSSFLDD